MPDRVEVFDVTCPASTPETEPIEVAFDYPPGIPRKVTIIIPDGHAGLTGIALGYGHNAVIPRTTGKFISSNDEFITFDLSNYPAGPIWSAFVCNNDLLPHAWEVILELDEIAATTNAPAQAALPVADIVTTGADIMAQEAAATPIPVEDVTAAATDALPDGSTDASTSLTE